MGLKEFVSRFIRHSMWALSATVIVMFAMEFFIPGSVTPYMDPIPWAIVALLALTIDAAKRSAVSNIWLRIGIGIILLVIFALMIGSDIQAWSKSNIILIFVIMIMVGLTTWFVSSAKTKS
jgi:hypothetical protein